MINTYMEHIEHAIEHSTPILIRGSGSKDFYGGPLIGSTLDTSNHTGIIDYTPSELVITARAGTPLTEIVNALSEQNQMLAFEPPHFGENATLGGCIASGLSGPRRPYSGSTRDFVLGITMLDGCGQHLKFGGQVMKNVAGYDVSRLMTGSLGTLGLLLDISLKVLPLPAKMLSLQFNLDEQAALRQVNLWAGQSLPLSATSWLNGQLTIRLEGSSQGVEAARTKLGGVELSDSKYFWQALREQRTDFFTSALPLWRFSLPSSAEPLKLAGQQLIEWGGALRWIYSDLSAEKIRQIAEAAGGQATLFRQTQKTTHSFHPVPNPLLAIQKKLKHTFDPHGIFNPKRMFAEF